MKNLLDWLSWRRKAGRQEDFTQMEAYLDATLKPVAPRKAYVRDLRTRLMKASLPTPIALTSSQYAIVGVAGVISVLIIIVTGVRATLTILAALGLWRHFQDQMIRENQSHKGQVKSGL